MMRTIQPTRECGNNMSNGCKISNRQGVMIEDPKIKRPKKYNLIIKVMAQNIKTISEFRLYT